MGLSRDLAEAARGLRKDIEDGLVIKQALLKFADRVEAAAEATKTTLKLLQDYPKT